MLNGIDPIIIFNFKKLIPNVTEGVADVPIIAEVRNLISLPLIPIYLSERLTGIVIQSESKNIDIDTSTDALTDGSSPNVNQRPIGSTVKIEMQASRNSIGVALFSAMADLIFPKVTSKEYSITYLHGAVTVFNGLLHAFSITQNTDNDLYNITLELVKPAAQAVVSTLPQVGKLTGAAVLGS